MPILHVKVAAPRSDELTRQIASTLVEVTKRVLGKNPELMAVTVTYVDPRDWIVAGRSLAEQGKSSFFLDIKVVDETNTKAEKAQVRAGGVRGRRSPAAQCARGNLYPRPRRAPDCLRLRRSHPGIPLSPPAHVNECRRATRTTLLGRGRLPWRSATLNIRVACSLPCPWRQKIPHPNRSPDSSSCRRKGRRTVRGSGASPSTGAPLPELASGAGPPAKGACDHRLLGCRPCAPRPADRREFQIILFVQAARPGTPRSRWSRVRRRRRRGGIRSRRTCS